MNKEKLELKYSTLGYISIGLLFGGGILVGNNYIVSGLIMAFSGVLVSGLNHLAYIVSLEKQDE